MERIAIIGGGIIGTAIAWELARRGVAVELFDRRPLGGGATQASAGMLVPYIEGHDPGPLRDLAVRSFDMYDDFVARLAADARSGIEYRQVGTLQVAPDEVTAKGLRQSAGDGSGLHEWLGTEELQSVEPAIAATASGALLVRVHRYVVVGTLLQALVEAASAHGARLHVGRGVASVRTESGSVRLTMDDDAVLVFDRVIVCAGSWTATLVTDDAVVRAVRPVRGQLVRLGWPGPPLRHIVWGPGCYVVPWLDGTVLVGATMEEVGFDERTTAGGVRDLLEAVCALLPDARRATFVEARVGLRPGNTDGLPIVGLSTSSTRMLYATGHFRNGILLAPLTASLVADLVVADRRDPALDVLNPARLHTKKGDSHTS